MNGGRRMAADGGKPSVPPPPDSCMDVPRPDVPIDIISQYDIDRTGEQITNGGELEALARVIAAIFERSGINDVADQT